MFPLLKNNSYVGIEYTKNIKFSDIAVFKRKKYVIHRIVKINRDNIITKGDNNSFFDKPIKKNKIIAKVIKINERDFNLFNNKLIAYISYLQGKVCHSKLKNKSLDKFFKILIKILS